MALYLLFIVCQVVFRKLYYGVWFPNTYYLKLTGMPLLMRWENGINYLGLFYNETRVLLILPLVDLVFGYSKKKMVLAAIVALIILYQINIGGDAWLYWRMLSPIVPLIIILYIQASSTLVLTITKSQAYRSYILRNPIFPPLSIPGMLIILMSLISFWPTGIRFYREATLFDRPYQSQQNKANVNVAIAINNLTSEDATVGVFWAGAIPYYTGRRAVDFLGKSDSYIAHLPVFIKRSGDWSDSASVPGHNKFDLNYSIKSLQPTFVQAFVWRQQDLTEWAATRYASVEYYKGVLIYLLKDSPYVYWDKIQTK